MNLLHKDVNIFFQYPSDDKRSYTAKGGREKHAWFNDVSHINKSQFKQKLHKSHCQENNSNSHEEEQFQSLQTLQELRFFETLLVCTNS